MDKQNMHLNKTRIKKDYFFSKVCLYIQALGESPWVLSTVYIRKKKKECRQGRAQDFSKGGAQAGGHPGSAGGSIYIRILICNFL